MLYEVLNKHVYSKQKYNLFICMYVCMQDIKLMSLKKLFCTIVHYLYYKCNMICIRVY